MFVLVFSCLLPLIITNTKICTFDTIHVKKQHNAELWHIIEMLMTTEVKTTLQPCIKFNVAKVV